MIVIFTTVNMASVKGLVVSTVWSELVDPSVKNILLSNSDQRRWVSYRRVLIYCISRILAVFKFGFIPVVKVGITFRYIATKNQTHTVITF